MYWLHTYTAARSVGKQGTNETVERTSSVHVLTTLAQRCGRSRPIISHYLSTVATITLLSLTLPAQLSNCEDSHPWQERAE